MEPEFEYCLQNLCTSLKTLGILYFNVSPDDKFAERFENYVKDNFSIGSSRFSRHDRNTPNKCKIFGITFIFSK